MKKLLSLILCITMLTSVAQLTAFADIESPDSASAVGSSLSAEVGDESDSTDSTQAADSSEASAKGVQQSADSKEESTTADSSSDSDVKILSKAAYSDAEAVSAVSDAFKNSAAYTKYPVFASLCKDNIDMSNLIGSANKFTKTQDNNNKNVDCPDMVPQGFCSATVNGTSYLLVSAYCSKTSVDSTTAATGSNFKSNTTHKHKSVIYVYENPTNGSPTYKGTLVLPCYSHVGGIAYVPSTGYLWVALNYHDNKSDSSKGYSNCFNLSTEIAKFSASNTKVVVSGFVRSTADSFSDPAVPDSMTYDENNNRVLICKYEYASGAGRQYNGVSIATRYTDDGADLVYKDRIQLPCDRIQGLDFVNKYDKTTVIVARSWSRDTSSANYISELLFYDYTNSSFTFKARIKMPPMVEGVSYDEDKALLYVTFESGAYKFNGGESSRCPAPVPYIVALDIEDYLNYDRVLDLGGVSGTEMVDAITPGATERIILDQNLPATKIGTSKNVDYDVSGTDFLYKYTPSDKPTETYHATIYNSNVASGESVLVKLHGDVDIAGQVDKDSDKSLTDENYTTDGFLVKDGGKLTVKSVKEGSNNTVSIRRNAFKYEVPNSIYLETIINVEKGGTLNITNKNGDTENARIRIKGGGEDNYVQATNSVIRTISVGSSTSNWSIEGVDFEGITTATGCKYAYAPCLLPYDKFTNLTIKDCNFRNIFAKKGQLYSYTTNKNIYGKREGAAIVVTNSFNASGTVEISDCTFDNDYSNKGINLLKDNEDGPYKGATVATIEDTINDNKAEFEGIRFQGAATTMKMNNVSFTNFEPEYGVVGFVRRNYSDYDTSSGNKLEENSNIINSLSITNISMTNCNATATKARKIATCAANLKTTNGDANQDRVEPHYYGPLTIGSNITALTITDPKFENCSSFDCGGISFDSDNIQNTTTGILTDRKVIGTVKIQGSAAVPEDGNTANAYFKNCTGKKNAGAIGVFGYIENSLAIDKVLIDSCKSTNGSAVMIRGESSKNANYKLGAKVKNMSITNSLIQKCESKHFIFTGSNFAGTIRTTGPAMCKLKISGTTIRNNSVWKDGGGIYWNAGGEFETGDFETGVSKKSLLTVDKCQIYGNNAAQSGGGIYCEADMKITNTNIYNNTAYEDGGGICQTVYSNSDEYISLKETNLTLDTGVSVHNNYAYQNGGGIALTLRDSKNLYYGTNGASYSPEYYDDKKTNKKQLSTDFTMSFSISDALTPADITENFAGNYGGGVYFGKASQLVGSSIPNSEEHLEYMDDYTKTVNLFGGTIKANQAGLDGGGVAVLAANATVNLGDPSVTTNTGTTVTANRASFGQAVKVGTDTLKTPKDILGIDNYRSYSYTKDNSGACVLSQPAIDFSDNTSATANGLGGGIYMQGSKSKSIVTGGSVDNNIANHGGGLYSAASTTIEVNGGKISENKAYYNGGGAYSDNGTVTVTGGNIEKNIAGYEDANRTGAGGGGAVFAINGGDITVTGGLLRYNEAKGKPSQEITTTFEGATYIGTGGAICVANGVAGNTSTFTLENAGIDSTVNMGIYSNLADFAADDVYSSGSNTDLNVPNVSEMNLSEYDGKATGWFEDYANGESNYAQGTYLGSKDQKTTGSRYRTNIQSYSNKYEIENVNSNSHGDVVNDANAFVCMTLGTQARVTITHNLYDYKGNAITGDNNSANEGFAFKLDSVKGYLPENLTYEINGETYNVTLGDNATTFVFELKGGETIGFPSLPANVKIVPTQTTTKNEKNYLRKTDGENKVIAGSSSSTDTFESYTAKTIDTNNDETVVVFNNYLMGIEVVINFYDRKVSTTGIPAEIDEKATAYTKTFVGKECESFMNQDDPIEDMIINASAYQKDKYKNVVDDYILWTSQTNAEKEIKNLATNSKYEELLSKEGKYDNESDYAYRANHKGEPQSENWVTYKNYSDSNVTQSDYEATGVDKKAKAQDIKVVNVWMLNTPKKYSVTIHGLSDASKQPTKVKVEDKYVYVAQDQTESGNLYYNQRLGTKGQTDAENENTTHLGNYDLGGFLDGDSKLEAKTLPEFTDGSNTYKFSYWSFDKDGKTVASTNISYDYRITQNVELYAVYENTAKSNVGVTTTMNRPDVYFDNEGVQRTRLNTMINPYNCEDSDKNISAVAAVYIVPQNGASTASEDIKNAIKTAFAKLGSADAKGHFKLTTGVGNYTVYTVNQENSILDLTIKNRAEFVLGFKTESLESKTIYAYTAMKYAGNWIVSDNYIDYSFDGNGVFTGGADHILGEKAVAASDFE